jgi:hypothetical protein
MRDEEAKRVMLDMAAGYDRLAEIAEAAVGRATLGKAAEDQLTRR